MSRFEKPIVLLVDDNEATCTLITALLRREFEVETAADGNEAVEKLRTKEYDAVLLDIRMPGLDGYGVLEFLHTTRPELLARTLILTAALTTKELERVRSYPICGIVAKPFDVELLLAQVKECAQVDGSISSTNLLSSGMFLLLAEVIRELK